MIFLKIACVELNVIIAVFLLESFIFLSVNSQDVTAEKPNVTVVRGENTTLKWLLNKGSEHEFSKVKTYRGDRPYENSLLFDDNNELTDFAARDFENRLTGKLRFNKTKYELTITDVHYLDSGPFNIEASFVVSRDKPHVYKNVTLILNVRGKFPVFRVIFLVFIVFL